MISPTITITSDEVNCLIYSYFQDCGKLCHSHSPKQPLTFALGFNHSAFALRNEARLQNSPLSQKHIPRGELVELLSKALLYLEVEAHWRNDSLTTNCKNGFSLIDQHVCSLDDTQERASSVQDNNMDIGDTDSISTHGMALSTSHHPYTASQPKDSLPPRNGDTKAHSQNQYSDSPNQLLAPSSDNNVKRKTSPIPIDGHVEKRARHASVEMDVDDQSECPFIYKLTYLDYKFINLYYSCAVDTSRSYSFVGTHSGAYTSRTSPSWPRRQYNRSSCYTITSWTPERGNKNSKHTTHTCTNGIQVFVCAFNPKRHNFLASGSVVIVLFFFYLQL